jgi:hypothetical protein
MSPTLGWTTWRARWGAVAPRRKALLALLLVFAGGLAAGALLEDVVDEIERPLFAARDYDEDDLTEESLLASLGLSPEQEAQIERLFDSREDRLEAYWDARLPELERMIDSSRDEIRATLTPGQRGVYDSQLVRLRFQPRRDLEDDDDDD